MPSGSVTLPGPSLSQIWREQKQKIGLTGVGVIISSVSALVPAPQWLSISLIVVGGAMVLFALTQLAWGGWFPTPTGKVSLTKAAKSLYNTGGEDFREKARIVAGVTAQLDHNKDREYLVDFCRSQVLKAGKRGIISVWARRANGLTLERLKPDEIESADHHPDDSLSPDGLNQPKQLFDVRVPRWQLGRVRRAWAAKLLM